MSKDITCGEATMRLLADYGVDTVFGVPGVHTLAFCKGLADQPGQAPVRHVQARNEQGAGYMADGWARASGKPGAMLVISGPGVTNAATALGQGYADSQPLLMISAEPHSATLGKGWGALHEITEQKAVTAPLTTLSATAHRAAEIPTYMAQAMTGFASGRPRPAHISVPVDVQEEMVGPWSPAEPPARPVVAPEIVSAAARLLAEAKNPLFIVGGGAVGAAGPLIAIAERVGAVVAATPAGKGVAPDDHPLSLGSPLCEPAFLNLAREADVILAIGTELSNSTFYDGPLEHSADLIRVDIDPRKITDFYPAKIGAVGDAGPFAAALLAQLGDHDDREARAAAEARAADVRAAIRRSLSPVQERHAALLAAFREAAPEETFVAADACQPAYSSQFLLPFRQPRKWFFTDGFCTLGGALPGAIGAQLAMPGQPTAVLIGDGGFMFTAPELLTAADLGVPIAIILYDNAGLKQIRDDMERLQIGPVGVDGMRPDFELLAKACHTAYARPADRAGFQAALTAAFAAGGPTLIHVRESDAWLAEG